MPRAIARLVVFSSVLLLACPADLRAADVVPGQYIVLLERGVHEDAGRIAGDHGGTLVHRFTLVHGFAARIPLQALGRLMSDPRVARVEADGLAWAIGADARPQGKGSGPTPPPPQTLPTGVDRIDADLNPNEGTGIKVAVIDTGIELAHPDLSTNVKGQVTFVLGTKSGNDDHGHGTHVAGTIGALDNAFGVVGVASQTSLYAVKVLDRTGSGSYSAIIKGVEWAQINGMRVANMSLGGTVPSEALRQALVAAKAAGVTIVVAAGNSGADANYFYPAAYDEAVITVSAIDPSTDTFATFSNYGVPPIDLGGPGVSILSTFKGGTYRTLSGTSMAAPHVSGAAALVVRSRGLLGLATTPDDVKARLAGTAMPVAGNTAQHPEPLVYARDL